jgi:hypothetical protein
MSIFRATRALAELSVDCIGERRKRATWLGDEFPDELGVEPPLGEKLFHRLAERGGFSMLLVRPCGLTGSNPPSGEVI